MKHTILILSSLLSATTGFGLTTSYTSRRSFTPSTKTSLAALKDGEKVSPPPPHLSLSLSLSLSYSSTPTSTLTLTLTPTLTPTQVILIGVAADSGCGKSTFMRRLTNIFGGESVGPLGGGFPESWETNTLVSDKTTVICLDDFHLNDRAGRKVTKLTALDARENNFDLMYEQLAALKSGKTIQKPIYNHVNGTLDTPETIEPTPIVIIEGLHPMYDSRVRDLLDFSLYLDISDDVKFAWKIQRDMEERGHSLESIKASIEARKPDFDQVRHFAFCILHFARQN